MGVFYPSAFLCITEMPEIMRPLDHRKQESGCSLYRKVDTEQPSSPDTAWAQRPVFQLGIISEDVFFSL